MELHKSTDFRIRPVIISSYLIYLVIPVISVYYYYLLWVLYFLHGLLNVTICFPTCNVMTKHLYRQKSARHVSSCKKLILCLTIFVFSYSVQFKKKNVKVTAHSCMLFYLLRFCCCIGKILWVFGIKCRKHFSIT